MIVNFQYNINMGSHEMINSSIYFKLNDSDYYALTKAYKNNSFPLFLNECPEIRRIENNVRNAIYKENAAVYLANKDFINKIIDDKELSLTELNQKDLVAAYDEIFSCDISFPKLVVKEFDFFRH